MKEVLNALIASRKIWIGGATVIVVAILRLVLPHLGLTDEVAITQVADSVLVIALVVIGALTAQNVVSIAKNGGKK